NSVECNLGSLSGTVEGDAYTIHYSISAQADAEVGADVLVIITLAFDSVDGGVATERATKGYQLFATNGGSDSISFSHVQQGIVVSGLTTNDDIRIRLKSIQI